MIIRLEFSKITETEALRTEVADVMDDLIKCMELGEDKNISDWADWIMDITETLERFQDIFDEHTKISVDIEPTAQL